MSAGSDFYCVGVRDLTREQYLQARRLRRSLENADRDPEERRTGGMRPLTHDFLNLFGSTPQTRLAAIRRNALAFVREPIIYRDNRPLPFPKEK